MQQIAQAGGLLVLLVVVTILARRLSVAQLGAYGLVASLAGYLLVLRNSVASSAVRAMAAAVEPGERTLVFSAAAVLYAAVGLATGLLIAGAGLAIAGLILEGDLARDARLGGLGLGAVTGAGISASVFLDGMRAERRFLHAARLEILALSLHLGLMLTLIFAGAGLAVLIAASGAIPLLSGLLCALAVRRLRLPLRLVPGGRPRSTRLGRVRTVGVTRSRVMEIVPTAGWLLVIELCNLAMYASGRIVLGAYRTPASVGLYEGPVRAHNLLYALSGALAVPVVPSASRYVAARDERRLQELVVRGTRYTLALFVPLCVTLMALSEPILEVWLGERYGEGGAALAILVSYWLLYGGLVVSPGFLVGAGLARAVARVMLGVAAANLVLALALTPELGLEGPALATAVPFVVAFPLLLRLGLQASGVTLTRIVGGAYLPAWVLGVSLALALAFVRFGIGPQTLPAVLGFAGGAIVLYWAAFYGLVLAPGERAFVRGLLRRRG